LALLLLMAVSGGYLSLSAESLQPRLAVTVDRADATPPVACCERPIGYPPHAEQVPTPPAGVQLYPYPYPAAYPGLHMERTK
jgi:hypothetical protein